MTTIERGNTWVDVFRFACLVGVRDFQSIWSWRTWLFGWGLRVGTSAITWVLVGRLLGSQSKLEYLLIGQLFVVGVVAVCWAIPSAVWDRMDGTFEPIILTPSGYFNVLVGRTVVWLGSGIGSGILTALILLAVFGLPIGMHQVLPLTIALVVACAAAYSFALVHGLLVARWPRTRNIFLGLVSIELTTLTGAVVPVEYWSPPIAAISPFLPVTNALGALRGDLVGNSSGFWSGVGAELGVCMLWFLVAAAISQRVVNMTRRNGVSE